ncbi:hypothetical protein [Streptomyces sp. SBT349]|uniref:hypothetical protein n=1 Tax=Streptomyces sp. SBT349 TaxID=1580539 RepID=UPI0007C6480F|nr:hypothetical protein [Streptomyces sp. SBT349]
MKVQGRSEIPSLGDAVRTLVAEGETSKHLGAGGAQALGGGLVVLAALLSGNPRKDEPIEDAFGGMVQELSYTGAR